MKTRVDALTARAPHVRAARDLGWVMRMVLVAATPPLLFGLYNTGYQANRALAALGRKAAAGWRGSLLESLGAGCDAASVPACLLHGTLWFLPLLLVSAVTGVAWERLFARLRRRPLRPGLGVSAVLFSLCLPPTLPPWQAALGMSFGIVLGREIFGGTGKNFLNPALVGLAFLYFSFPAQMQGAAVWTPVDGYTGATGLALAAAGGSEAILAGDISWMQSFTGRIPGAFGETSTLACLLGAAWLLLCHVASWRIMAGALLGMAATALCFQWIENDAFPVSDLPWYWHLTLGSFAFGTVFFATDPVSAAATDPGRWIYGLWIGFLIVLIRVANPLHPDGVMLAILLGNVFAPLIDHGVVRANIRRRRRRSLD